MRACPGKDHEIRAKAPPWRGSGPEDGGLGDGVYVLGVNMKQYRDFFGDNLKLIEGKL